MLPIQFSEWAQTLGSLTSMTLTHLAMSNVNNVLLITANIQRIMSASISIFPMEQTHSVVTIVQEFCVDLVEENLASL